MGKEIIIQRMYNPGREAVSFALRSNDKRNSDYILLDAPLVSGSLLPPDRSSAVFYTHFHKDHCPQKDSFNNKGEDGFSSVKFYFNQDTLVLLNRIGVDTSRLNRNIGILTPGQKIKIDSFGTVLPIRVSHSSVDALSFWIELESGHTVFYSGDIRSGIRTDLAIEKIRELCGKSGISLFIGDATGVGKEHISRQDHLDRLKQALRLAKANQAPTALFVKAGDYGNIPFWFQNRVFEDCEVFLSSSLHKVLSDLGWLPLLLRRYGYMPPDLRCLDDYIDKKREVVFLYDDCWKNQINHRPYVLVNSSRREIPYRSDFVIAMFPIGFSGHSEEAFYGFLEACNPDFVAYSHLPGKGSVDAGRVGLAMKRRGDVFPL